MKKRKKFNKWWSMILSAMCSPRWLYSIDEKKLTINNYRYCIWLTHALFPSSLSNIVRLWHIYNWGSPGSSVPVSRNMHWSCLALTAWMWRTLEKLSWRRADRARNVIPEKSLFFLFSSFWLFQYTVCDLYHLILYYQFHNLTCVLWVIKFRRQLHHSLLRQVFLGDSDVIFVLYYRYWIKTEKNRHWIKTEQKETGEER